MRMRLAAIMIWAIRLMFLSPLGHVETKFQSHFGVRLMGHSFKHRFLFKNTENRSILKCKVVRVFLQIYFGCLVQCF